MELWLTREVAAALGVRPESVADVGRMLGLRPVPFPGSPAGKGWSAAQRAMIAHAFNAPTPAVRPQLPPVNRRKQPA